MYTAPKDACGHCGIGGDHTLAVGCAGWIGLPGSSPSPTGPDATLLLLAGRTITMKVCKYTIQWFPYKKWIFLAHLNDSNVFVQLVFNCSFVYSFTTFYASKGWITFNFHFCWKCVYPKLYLTTPVWNHTSHRFARSGGKADANFTMEFSALVIKTCCWSISVW